MFRESLVQDHTVRSGLSTPGVLPPPPRGSPGPPGAWLAGWLCDGGGLSGGPCCERDPGSLTYFSRVPNRKQSGDGPGHGATGGSQCRLPQTRFLSKGLHTCKVVMNSESSAAVQALQEALRKPGCSGAQSTGPK